MGLCAHRCPARLSWLKSDSPTSQRKSGLQRLVPVQLSSPGHVATKRTARAQLDPIPVNRDFCYVFCYDSKMTKVANRLSPEEIAITRKRRLEAVHLQVIEGNPLDEEDIAMFEMFEREGWDHERCREYILARARGLNK